MSESRPRTGLAKPREIEREFLEVHWRDTGAAITSTSDRKALDLRSQAIAASDVWGVDLTEVPILERNPIADGLLQLSIATGNEVFSKAFEEMRRLGLDGPDGYSKLSAMMPPSDAERAMEAFVETHRATGSVEGALEKAAVRYAVPSLSFDGAIQAVKRMWLNRKK